MNETSAETLSVVVEREIGGGQIGFECAHDAVEAHALPGVTLVVQPRLAHADPARGAKALGNGLQGVLHVSIAVESRFGGVR